MHDISLRLAARLFDKPLIDNSFRSAFVEEMVEPFLYVGWWRYVGERWNGWDFERPDHKKLEVKQSAAHQTWPGPPGKGRFDIGARTGFFDNGGSKFVTSAGRQADVYVFAWNGKYGAETDHRNQDQWEFYVVPSSLLPSGQKTLALSGVKQLASQAGQDAPRSIHALLSRMNDVLSDEMAQETIPMIVTSP